MARTKKTEEEIDDNATINTSSLVALKDTDLNSLNIADGDYYCDSSNSGLPEGQSAGRFQQASYNDGTNLIYIEQTFTGLLHYGQTELSRYRRFLFGKEVIEGNNAISTEWVRDRYISGM
jgi:hypothetical protein